MSKQQETQKWPGKFLKELDRTLRNSYACWSFKLSGWAKQQIIHSWGENWMMVLKNFGDCIFHFCKFYLVIFPICYNTFYRFQFLQIFSSSLKKLFTCSQQSCFKVCLKTTISEVFCGTLCCLLFPLVITQHSLLCFRTDYLWLLVIILGKNHFWGWVLRIMVQISIKDFLLLLLGIRGDD